MGRWGAVVALAVLSACTGASDVAIDPESSSTSVTAAPEADPPTDWLTVGVGDIVRYGSAPQQFAELVLPEGAGPFPVMVFIHGGFWRNSFDLSLAQPQAADARANGYATWNLEYRRVGDAGGGYPGTLDDIATAVDALTRIDAPLDLGRVAVVGHSAGGHLALWVGQRDDPAVTPVVVVGQAPVADLANSLDLGRGAVEAFMGTSPAADPDAYDLADPARRLPVRVPQLIVHGDADDIVPVASVEPYVAAAGATVDFRVFDGADHFDVIDPSHVSWSATLAAIEEFMSPS